MIIKLFQEIASKYAAKTAIQSASRHLTYDQLNKFSNRLARTLLEEFPHIEDRQLSVGILMEQGAMQPAALLGTLKTGGLYVPMDPFYPDQRLEYMLRNSEASVILTDAVNFEKAERIVTQARLPVQLINVEEPLATQDDTNLELRLPGDRLAYILFTSGSTGKPKGVVQSLDNVLYYTRNWIQRFDITSVDRMTFLTAFCHDGAVQDIFSALLAGAALYPLDVKRVDIEQRMAGWLRDNCITIWHSVPTLFRYFAEGLQDGDLDVEHLRYILLGGEPLRDRDITLAAKRFPNTILANIYGQTESSVNSIFQIRPGDAPAKPVIGEPLSATDILLVDDEGDIVEDMGVGEIVVACPHLARGYWGDDELTEEKFGEDEDLGRIYWTGDLGARLGTGQIEILGRRDFQVKIRGFRVETGDIESALVAHPSVKEAVVKAILPEDGNMFLCAYCVAEGQDKAPDNAGLRQFLLGRLPDYMVPSRFVPLAEIPLTPNGKVDRNALPDALNCDPGIGYIAPRNKTEEVLVGIWAKVLGVPMDSIGIDHDFFQLGGHSLKAVTLTLKIHQELNIKLGLPDVFAQTTIRRQAALIGDSAQQEFTSIPAAPRMDHYPSTSQQRRLHFLFALKPDNIAYNMPQVIQLGGNIDRQAIERVFHQLVKRHEALRTSFVLKKGRLRQIIHDSVEFHLEEITAPAGASVEEVAGLFIRPFDLSRPPLLRVGLAERGNGQALLLVDLHHIIADGSSLGILVREFIALYGGVELPALSIHYKDYACWMEEARQVELLETQKRFWLSVFEEDPPLLELPLDTPRPPVHNFEGKGIAFSFDNRFTRQLEMAAAALGSTLYVLLLAAYSVFLAKLSDQEDIVVGTAVSGRQHADLHQVMGMFVNTLALRVRPVGELSFSSYVDAVNSHVIDAMNHQLYPFEELVENLKLENNANRNPIFDTMFTLRTFMDQEYDIPTATTGDLEASPIDFHSPRSLFDLTLQGERLPSGLSFTLEYSPNLFKQATIQRFIDFFTEILTLIAEDSDTPLQRISIMREEDRRLLAQSFNATESPLPQNQTVTDLFLRQVTAAPHRLALTDGDRHLTYDALLQQALGIASRLQGAGAGKETIVAVMSEHSLETAAGIMGIMLCGAAFLPVNPDEPAAGLRFKLQDAAARWLLALSGSSLLELPGVQIIECAGTHIQDPESLPSSREPEDDHLAYVVYDAGSVDLSAGVLVEHRGLFNGISWFLADTELSEHDRLALMTGFTCAASFEVFFGTLSGGAVLDLVAAELLGDPRALLDFFRIRSTTILTYAPSFLRQVFTGDWEENGVRLVIGVGEPFTNGTKDFFLRCGLSVRHHYGYAETTNTALGDLGQPVHNVRSYIIDRNHLQLPIGVFGRIAIGGSGVARGYLNRPELQAERFISLPHIDEGPLFKTGDRGRVTMELGIEYALPDDRYITLRGNRIDLQEIEYVIAALPGVAFAGVLADKGDDGIPVIRSFLVPLKKESIEEEHRALLKKIQEYLPSRLPEYMIPTQFEILDRLPRTPLGAVDRNALRARNKGTDTFVPPETPMERSLAGLFASVLSRPEAEIPSNRGFFQLGGNSLSLLRLVAAISNQMNVNVPVLQVFQTPTVQSLASYLEHSGVPDDRQSHMALLNDGDDSDDRGQAPLFCFPPFTGLGISYLELARLLPNYSIYAFDFDDNRDRISRYADMIQEVQPSEPLILMGYSVGGVLAHQVASELERRGRRVAGLLLLDCFLPEDVDVTAGEEPRRRQLLDAVKISMENLNLNFPLDDALDRARQYIDYFYCSSLAKNLATDLFLLKCGDRDQLASQRGWDVYTTGKVHVVSAAGDHYRMLSGSNAEANGRLIVQILQRNISKPNGG